MIRVTLDNINDFNLPLYTYEKVTKRGDAKRVLKELEKKYNLKTKYECVRYYNTFTLYANASNNYVPEEDKDKWISNFEIYIKSSFVYKFWIWFYRLKNKLNL